MSYLKDILDKVARGEITPKDALQTLDLELVRREACGVTLDPYREYRAALGEVVFGPGKDNEQLKTAVAGLHASGDPVMATKLTPGQGEFLAREFPEGKFWERPGLFILGKRVSLDEPWPEQGDVVIVSAGSSDLSVALEALGTALFFDLDAGLISDVGVAGLHRLSPHLKTLTKARAVIVAAGMDGALPSVIGGLCPCPVIALPTSVGYGASFSGLAALLTMLNSCAPGNAVVNINNGFGAACFAAKLLKNRRHD